MNNQIRCDLIKKRKALSYQDQNTTSKNILRFFLQQNFPLKNKKIASYLAVNGEADACLIHQLFHQQEQAIFLPIINKEKLIFGRWEKNTPLYNNAFNIAEPGDNAPILAENLDIILMPLVAFKKEGSRLGMGGGFYDKTLGGISTTKRPLLIGLAHEFQLNEHFTVQSWDIPLDLILTDSCIYRKKSL